ncbi:MAG: hypothetical protein AAGK04_13820 [Planctomycetota bacterium]
MSEDNISESPAESPSAPGAPPELVPHPTPLASAPKAYVETVQKGLQFVIYGTLAQIGFALLVLIASVGASFLGETVVNVVGLLAALIGTGIAAIVLMGWMRFSEPDESVAGEHDGAEPRKLVRLAVYILAGLYALNLLASLLAFIGLGILALPVSLLLFLATAFMLFAAMGYVNWMATRIPSEETYERSKMYRWLLPLLYFPGCALIVAPLVGLVLYLLLLFKVKEEIEGVQGASPA